MRKQLHKNLFNETECLSEQIIFEYIDNALSPEQRYNVEKHLVDCELCSDALEGLALVNNRNVITDSKKLVKETFSSDKKHERKVIWFDFKYKLLAAASVALLISSVFIFNYFINKNESTVAYKTPSETEISETPIETTIPLTNGVKEDESKIDIQSETISSEPVQKTESNHNKLSLSDKKTALKGEQKLNTKDHLIVSEESRDDKNRLSTSIPDEKSESILKKSGDVESPTSDLAAPTKIPVEKNEPKGAFGQSAGTSNKATESSAVEEKSKDANERGRKEDELGFENKAKAEEAQQSTKRGKIELAKKSRAPQSVISQTMQTASVEDAIYDEAPKYLGGETELQKFINNNQDLKNCLNCKGNISVTLVINNRGELQYPKILKGVAGCECLNNEAIRLIKLMPNWEPAKLNGNTVSTNYIFSIEF